MVASSCLSGCCTFLKFKIPAIPHTIIYPQAKCHLIARKNLLKESATSRCHKVREGKVYDKLCTRDALHFRFLGT
jgi:hypothetical protein